LSGGGKTHFIARLRRAGWILFGLLCLLAVEAWAIVVATYDQAVRLFKYVIGRFLGRRNRQASQASSPERVWPSDSVGWRRVIIGACVVVASLLWITLFRGSSMPSLSSKQGEHAAKSERPWDSGGADLRVSLGNGVSLDLIRVPKGSFIMGSTTGDKDSGERPSHRVNITRSFYLGKFEVTLAQWQAVMGKHPNYAGDNPSDIPVGFVTWEGANEFCKKLSQHPKERSAKHSYRLPTEAEWEYACRAGSTGKWCFGDDERRLRDYAWYAGNSDAGVHRVGQRKPNAWGFYDMHGNAWEWCADWLSDNYYRVSPANDPRGPSDDGTTHIYGRVMRGGASDTHADEIRCAHRAAEDPANWGGLNCGFRVVMVPQ
jgi:formylglycine-generating enzyme required for sulfatase activity